MACYHPLTAFRKSGVVNRESGKRPITFNPKEANPLEDALQLPCGQCIGCRLERSRQWALRCIHESSLYEKNCFLTLTYSPDMIHHLPQFIHPETGEVFHGLNKRHMVLFMKRLRKKFGEGIRFFQCGEYGEKNGRAHHHCLLFNFDFPDKVLHTMVNGFPVYKSEILKELWPYGFAGIGNVTFESAAYVARYITKKINGDNSSLHYFGRDPEYLTMSRRPGIGRTWFEQFRSGVYPNDYCVVRDMKLRPPKYYDKIFEMEDSLTFGRIKEVRITRMRKSLHNTPHRLAVREKIQLAKFAKLPRKLEE